MASVLNQPFFQNEEAAYAKLESIVWPNGPVCPHCGNTDRVRKLNGTATRPGVHKCYACRKQCRVTVGTVFESSHVPVHMWLQAAYLMCSSKKGISSNQLARTLGVTIKTGWFMSHRLREAMTAGTLPPMGGEGRRVEIDETFIGKKQEGRRCARLRAQERGADPGAARRLCPLLPRGRHEGIRSAADHQGERRCPART